MANQDLVYVWGRTGQGLPPRGLDTNYQPLRTGPYGDLVNTPLYGAKAHAAVDEQSYYTAVNPTAGTAIIDTAALTGFVTTTPTMIVFNGNATTTNGIPGKSIYLDYLRLNVVAAGASGTNWAWAMYLDTGNRYTSGGSAITPKNANIASSNTSNATISFGALLATAANAQRQVAAQPGRTVIKVAGDEYLFDFGGSVPISNGMPMEGALQLTRVFKCPPIVIPPQCSFCFYEWGASQATAASFEFNLAYWER